MECVSPDVVRSLLLLGKTYSEISTELQQLHPHICRGLSARSVRRYVKDNNLKETCEKDREDVIEEGVQEVSNCSILHTRSHIHVHTHSHTHNSLVLSSYVEDS